MKPNNPFTQIKKGTLEYCVLAVIARGEQYGYEIVKILQEQGLNTPEGTIYPLLARLKKDGLVTAVWREAESGNPRKYYTITARGEEALAEFRASWSEFKTVVDNILRGGLD
ncbi:MAG TPA: PadR family transcriptional regulator [Bacillota bacterium]|nr:PadR family transcriptional regulator [Bacillota bacterium]